MSDYRFSAHFRRFTFHDIKFFHVQAFLTVIENLSVICKITNSDFE